MDYELSFGERLGDIMKEKDINGKTLSKITGISTSNISDMLNGKRENPTIKHIIKLSKSLNVSTDYLLGLSDTMSTDLEINNICKKLGLSESAVSNIIQIYENGKTGAILDIKRGTALQGLLSLDFDILTSLLVEILDYVLFTVDKNSPQEVEATISPINSITFKVSEQVIKNAIIHDIQATLDYIRDDEKKREKKINYETT